MRTEPNKYQIDLGISEQNRLKIAEGLSKLLADSYSVYLKTHKFPAYRDWETDRKSTRLNSSH